MKERPCITVRNYTVRISLLRQWRPLAQNTLQTNFTGDKYIQNYSNFFYRMTLCVSVVCAVGRCLSIRPSVHLSRSCIVSKWLNISQFQGFKNLAVCSSIGIVQTSTKRNLEIQYDFHCTYSTVDSFINFMKLLMMPGITSMFMTSLYTLLPSRNLTHYEQMLCRT